MHVVGDAVVANLLIEIGVLSAELIKPTRAPLAQETIPHRGQWRKVRRLLCAKRHTAQLIKMAGVARLSVVIHKDLPDRGISHRIGMRRSNEIGRINGVHLSM